MEAARGSPTIEPPEQNSVKYTERYLRLEGIKGEKRTISEQTA